MAVDLKGRRTLYDVPAPAKINLFLHVIGRRADGYHLLETVFRFIDLCDTLHFDRRADGQLSCDSPITGLATQDDLVMRAALALQRATGTRYGAHIGYHKEIPTGGGLGGGSSDAASTLIALNALWQTRLNRDDLMKLALSLGADVPVFIFGQSAFARGIGEQLMPVCLPDRAYVIVQPPQNVSTLQIFEAPELTRDSPSVKMSVFTDRHTSWPAPLFGRNDLAPVVYARYPRVHELSLLLGQQGFSSRMTGSGGCFFVELATGEQAVLCREQIIGKMPYCENDGAGLVRNVWACAGLHHHPLRHWLHS